MTAHGSVRDSELIVLAAGRGHRMGVDRPKCLMPIGGRYLIDHALYRLSSLVDRVSVVVSAQDDLVARHLRAHWPDVRVVVQGHSRGTGAAVRDVVKLGDLRARLFVLYADTPFVSADTLLRGLRGLDESSLLVCGFSPPDPDRYGRLIVAGQEVERIVEYADANESERAVDLCNAGMMAMRRATLERYIGRIGSHNGQREYYLTDLIALARAESQPVSWLAMPVHEALGVNRLADLARLEETYQERRRAEVLSQGVHLQSPSTVHLSFDTDLGPGTLVEPYVVFGPKVRLGSESRVRSFSYLEGVRGGERVDLGPFARIRPGTSLGTDTKVGNFVEIKASELGDRVKASHLSYIGDATLGDDVNIGAGAIFCNYDGEAKHRTRVGDQVFIGSNVSLVAPLDLGSGVRIGAGSVVTDDAPPGTLVLGRARQTIKRKKGSP